uniref:Uncharacterized protein n=1 Tax=Minutocellus polymorphus TaxID=265543 RepID=A0A7S0ACF9_9STRA|mmetsp:Transcript_10699/g.17772  ORF Transcript_10699/g.17772 Transcript_10699/m.17772 type:complete len:315 (+) Transcript_10699:232-1176(+)
MEGFGGWEVFILLLVLTNVAANKCPSPARRDVAVSSPAFVAPSRPNAKYERVDRPITSTNDGRSTSSCNNVCQTTSLFGRSRLTEEEIEQRTEQLRVLLSFSEDEIDELVLLNRYALYRRNMAETYTPKLVLLQDRLGIDKESAGRLCLRAPRLITVSLRTLETRLDWLQGEMNIDRTEMRRIIECSPLVLSASTDTLDYLCRTFELNKEGLAEIIMKQPAILAISVERSIKPKLHFYSRLVGEKEAKKIIIESTNLLMRSLDKRLLPRLAEVEKSGLEIKWNKTLIQRLARRSNRLWDEYKLGDAKKGRPKGS